MKNIVLVAKQNSKSTSTFSSKVLFNVVTTELKLVIPANNSLYLKNQFDFMVKYGSDKATLTFKFTDYPKLDSINFNVGGINY